MGISHQAIKQNSKLLISRTKPSPVLIGLCFILIILLLRFLSFAVSGGLSTYLNMMKQLSTVGYDDYAAAQKIIMDSYNSVAVSDSIGLWGQVLIYAMLVMELMINVGFTIYCLGICEFRKVGVSSLFDGFSVFFKAIWLYILMAFFTLIWSLLLIIPGIVAFYKYRMAIYVMLENPHMSALECILESKRMMVGHKAELFVLDLSFLGWFLLTVVFPPAIIWLAPYFSVTNANYYIALRDIPGQNINEH